MGGHCEATSNEFMTPKTFLVNIQDIHRNVRLVLLVPPLFIEGNSHSSTGPFLYLLARQCRINRLSFSTMAGVRVCS